VDNSNFPVRKSLPPEKLPKRPLIAANARYIPADAGYFVVNMRLVNIAPASLLNLCTVNHEARNFCYISPSLRFVFIIVEPIFHDATLLGHAGQGKDYFNSMFNDLRKDTLYTKVTESGVGVDSAKVKSSTHQDLVNSTARWA